MFWITAILFLVSLDEPCESKSYLRVRHGRDAKDGEFPFVVLLMNLIPNTTKGERGCTGSAISQYWILTAAHCVAHSQPNSILILHTNFTANNVTNERFSYVRKIVMHPSYVDYSKEYGDLSEYLSSGNDVSLLLVTKLTLNNLGRLLAVDHLTMVGLSVTYVGGGDTDKTKPGLDAIRPLQVGEAGIVSCPDKEDKYVICLVAKCSKRGEEVQKPWYGDSGGPLLYDGRIIGVCSAGANDITEGREWYAAVSPHIDWIYSIMHNTFKAVTTSVPASK